MCSFGQLLGPKLRARASFVESFPTEIMKPESGKEFLKSSTASYLKPSWSCLQRRGVRPSAEDLSKRPGTPLRSLCLQVRARAREHRSPSNVAARIGSSCILSYDFRKTIRAFSLNYYSDLYTKNPLTPIKSMKTGFRATPHFVLHVTMCADTKARRASAAMWGSC